MITDQEAIQNIAANVRRLRTAAGISQDELALKINENPMAVSRLCRGIHEPKIGIVMRIAELFEVKIEELTATPKKKSLRSA